MIDTRKLDRILNRVEKPARYIGMEVGSIVKDPKTVDLRFAFAFPDVYEIGMSYTGLDIIYTLINQIEGYACERVFAPWTDMQREMEIEGVPLYSLESKTALKDFDILGFTLQYEMSYTNILNMMRLGGIPLMAEERDEEYPLIAAGGPCAFNPEPMADFIDLFFIGEGEESLLEVLRLYQEYRAAGHSRKAFLRAAAQLQGVYVPSLYELRYHADGTIKERVAIAEDAPMVVSKSYIPDLNEMHIPDRQIIPNIEVVHDRVVSEIFRGCTQGCRFCQAGMTNRPVREKNVATILSEVNSKLLQSGYDEVSLSSLSTCDYPRLMELINELIDQYASENIKVSLPSLRMDSESLGVLRQIETLRKGGLTFAPEAGTQRLRDVINKGITEEDIDRTLCHAFDDGYAGIKLYFMIGLPTETMEDIQGITDLAHHVVDLFFDREKEKIKGNLRVTVSASCFVPKPFTPFQWCGQDSLEEFAHKGQTLKDGVRHKKISVNYHDPKLSRMEGAISRGDRRVGAAILKALELGAVFDGWRDYFRYEIWEKAFEETGLSIDFYASRPRPLDEVLPWDFVDTGLTKGFLRREYEKAIKGEVTPDCRHACVGCGVNKNYPGGYCPCV